MALQPSALNVTAYINGIMDYEPLTICIKCGFMPGAFIPGMKCPECGDVML
jgi:hypothetical protein